MVIVVIIVIAVILYYSVYRRSLKTHPYTKCRACGGRGRFYHWLFPGAFGLCEKCGGRGREKRRGASPD